MANIMTSTTSNFHNTNNNANDTNTTFAQQVLSIAPSILKIPKLLSPVKFQHLLTLLLALPSPWNNQVSPIPKVFLSIVWPTGHLLFHKGVYAMFQRVADLMGMEEELFWYGVGCGLGRGVPDNNIDWLHWQSSLLLFLLLSSMDL